MVKTMKELKALTKDPKFPACETVGELIEVLQQLPNELPISVGLENGVKPVVFNRHRRNTVLGLEENDGTWDDDD